MFKTNRELKILIGILLLTVLLRLPGFFWGYKNFDLFQTDEMQHYGIARNLIHQFDPAVIPEAEVTDQFNGRGLGTQMALLGYPFLKLFHWSSYILLPIGRLLSIIYSVLLVWLVFWILRRESGDGWLALLSAALIGIVDLAVTQGHYGVPDTGYVFWALFAFYSTYVLWKSPSAVMRLPVLLGATLSVAMAFSFRFDVVPAVALFGVLIWNGLRRHLDVKTFWWTLAAAAVLCAGFFYLSVGFNYNIAEFLKSKKELFEGGYDIVQNGKYTHFLTNPLQYLFALLGGTSIFIFAASIISKWQLIRRKLEIPIAGWLRFLFAAMAAEFFFLWIGDATFVRRAIIFLPLMAMLAAVAMLGWRRWLIGAAIGYTLALTIISQYAFFKDNRYAAQEYLRQEHSSAAVAYSPYAKVKGAAFVGIAPKIAKADLLVMHEASYGRYGKNFTTPFMTKPSCCADVFLCLPDECSFTQQLFRGDLPYRLVKTFPIWHPFPERLLFKRLFGTYETFLGDVLIYQR